MAKEYEWHLRNCILISQSIKGIYISNKKKLFKTEYRMDLITAALEGVLASCSVVHKKAKACKKYLFRFFYSLLRDGPLKLYKTFIHA